MKQAGPTYDPLIKSNRICPVSAGKPAFWFPMGCQNDTRTRGTYRELETADERFFKTRRAMRKRFTGD